jgi:hypothetical protein
MTAIFPDGCPEDLPKLEFNVVVDEPDPDAPDVASQKKSKVTATYNGEAAGELEYGFVINDVLITRMKTVEKYQCRGCATQMIEALIAHYPDREVKDGGNSNEPVGDVVLTRWRENGILRDV